MDGVKTDAAASSVTVDCIWNITNDKFQKKNETGKFLTNFFPLSCVIYRVFTYTGYSFCGWCDAYITSLFLGFIFDSVSARWIIFGL